ncbi:glycosyl hydrolase family 8 [Falsiroseomonas sp. E2-1-a20]|uniref:glycosyl hydrolase family 8 n=1 Tax=Falsiroseomonas sp. E2-1-a20 TaxID=3239300 RepID=UPI003F340EBA
MLAESLLRSEPRSRTNPYGAPVEPTAPLASATRRRLVGGMSAMLALLPAGSAARNPQPAAPSVPMRAVQDSGSEWRAFQARFVTAEGRVVDTGNAGISHSEGQGYGMLFAESFGDRQAFERIHRWTRTRLRRTDGLHAWRFIPTAATPVADRNNATDGDLYIAWALLRAADRWQVPAWRREAQAMAQVILRELVVEVDGRTVLLPGAFGFEHADRVVTNPSYYAFPALRALARAMPDRAWGRLIDDGVEMLRGMRYGRWGLPADWVEIGRGRQAGIVQPAAGWPARFSFDAVRVPLHLAWAGMTSEPALRAATRFWNDPNMAARPAWTDLRNGQLSPYIAPAGIEAVAEVITAAEVNGRVARPLPGIARSPDYYSAALSLLSRIAQQENPRNAMAGVADPHAAPA